MATRADILARISAEVTILSDRLVNEEQNIRAYRIQHRRVHGINAVGARIDYWVYDEGGPGEQAIIAYDDWMDVTIGNRYLDWSDGQPPETETWNERYHGISIMEFGYGPREAGDKRIGVYNPSTDKLEVYRGEAPDPQPPQPLGQTIALGQCGRDTSTSFNPRNGRSNAEKVPIMEVVFLESPTGIGFFDIPNHEIILPTSITIARADVIIYFGAGNTTNNEGQRWHLQWQRNGQWIGQELATGFIKQESSSFKYGISSYLIDQHQGNDKRFSLWCWCTDRQTNTEVNDAVVLVEERHIDLENTIFPIEYWGIV